MGECSNPKHGGHKVYVGGIMDGHIDHVIASPERCPSDYGRSLGTLKRGGQRTWYLRDEPIVGTTAVYRAVAVSADPPPEVTATYPAATRPGHTDSDHESEEA